MRSNSISKLRRRGHAVIELALIGPWILLLFAAVFDFGFYAYSAMSVANAARVAAIEMGRRSGNALDQTLACTIAKDEMKYLLNSSSFPAACDQLPLIVVAGNAGVAVPGIEPDGSTNAAHPAARVRVTYQTVQMFPLPFLTGRLTLTRQAEMRVFE